MYSPFFVYSTFTQRRQSCSARAILNAFIKWSAFLTSTSPVGPSCVRGAVSQEPSSRLSAHIQSASSRMWRHSASVTSYFGSRKTLRRRPGWWKIPSAQEPTVSRERKLAHCGNKQTNLAGALGAHILRGFLLDLRIIFLIYLYYMWVVVHRDWCPWAPFCCVSDQLAWLTAAVSRRVQSDSAVGDDMCPEGCQPSAPWAEPVNTALALSTRFHGFEYMDGKLQLFSDHIHIRPIAVTGPH